MRQAEDAAKCAEYDAMAAALQAQEAAAQARVDAAQVGGAAKRVDNRFGLELLLYGVADAYHAAVLWQSADQSWNFGLYTKLDQALWHRPADPAMWDDNTDAEFDETTFEWVSTGHATSDDALRAWTGPSPGGFQYTRHIPQVAAACAELDAMAAGCPTSRAAAGQPA